MNKKTPFRVEFQTDANYRGRGMRLRNWQNLDFILERYWKIEVGGMATKKVREGGNNHKKLAGNLVLRPKNEKF